MLWQTQDLGGAMVGTPAVSPDGVIYVGTFGNELLALDSSNGNIKWRFGTQDWVWSGPVLSNGVLYVGDLSGFFYAVNSTDGTSQWRLQPQNAIVGPPVIVGDTIYLTTEGDTLFTISTAGNVITSKVIGGLIYASPVVSGDTLLVSPTNFDSLLVAMNMDGSQKWTYAPAKK
jgi:outer membrane protein assembly factor BamB